MAAGRVTPSSLPTQLYRGIAGPEDEAFLRLRLDRGSCKSGFSYDLAE